MVINVKSITAWILYFNNRISSFFFPRAWTHTASPAEPFMFALKGCITVRDSSYFLWLLFTLSTSHGQHYAPHERWFRNIHKDEGPVRDEVGSFTVSAPFEVLVYVGGVLRFARWSLWHVQDWLLRWEKFSILHDFATGVSFGVLVSLSSVCHINASADVTAALLREVE